jgi:hypothetical protein
LEKSPDIGEKWFTEVQLQNYVRRLKKLCTIHILCGWCFWIFIVIQTGHFTVTSFLWQSMK